VVDRLIARWHPDGDLIAQAAHAPDADSPSPGRARKLAARQPIGPERDQQKWNAVLRPIALQRI
jgi:hypothetical protein